MTTTVLLAFSLLAGVNRATTSLGSLEGEHVNGVNIYRGVPYAQPPTGERRFAPPVAPEPWKGMRAAKQFSPRCMQHPLFGDMNFRANGMSEDCLYLNIWTPMTKSTDRLPVLVYFFGGGFQAGDASEPRYDGESMARKGIVSVTVNYRLGVFGFLAHPDLTATSKHKASGNWGLMDQSAALHWVRQHIAAFGGDPNHIVIAGESAGSTSASAQMASPLSRNLVAGVIGESGSALSANARTTLAAAEQNGLKFAESIGLKTAADLRSAPATQIFEASGKPGVPRFNVITDGYFFPKPPTEIYAAGEQAHVPLLAGWNSEEQGPRSIFGTEPPTADNFRKAVEKLYPGNADAILKLYPPDADPLQAATDLASDRFIGFSTWRWVTAAVATGGKPVYRYYYARPRPAMTPEFANATPGLAGGVIRNSTTPPPPRPRGAVHSAEIEYALGNLATNKVYAWQPEDHAVSKQMQQYFANFIKTLNPNGPGLPNWPSVQSSSPPAVLHINVETKLKPAQDTARYELHEKLSR